MGKTTEFEPRFSKGEQELGMLPEEREGFEEFWNWHIDTIVSVPETSRARELAEHSRRVTRGLYGDTLDHDGFLDDITRIAFSPGQPTFARLSVLKALEEYTGRFGEMNAERLTQIHAALIERTDEWPQWEEEQGGVLTQERSRAISQQQMLIYAAMYNALGRPTPVDTTSETRATNAKALRVAAEILRERTLHLRTPSKDLTSVWGPEHIAQSSGIPYIRVMCPPGYLAGWEKMAEACSHGLPVEIGRFDWRLPSALFGVETHKHIRVSPSTGHISRKGTIHYIRLPPLPEMDEPALHPIDSIREVTEEQLTAGSMINSLSYYLAIRVYKDVQKKIDEIDANPSSQSRYARQYRSGGPLPIVTDFIDKAVRKIAGQARHRSIQARLAAGGEIVARSILDLANIEYQHETGQQWEDYIQLRDYLNQSVSALLMEYDPDSEEFRFRMPEEINQLAVQAILRNSSLDTLADLANIFFVDGETSFLTPEQLNTVEYYTDQVRSLIIRHKRNEISLDEQARCEELFRMFLQNVMRVRFETIRDLPMPQTDNGEKEISPSAPRGTIYEVA